MACLSDFIADTAYDQVGDHAFSFSNSDSAPKGAELGNDSYINPVRHKEDFSMWRHYPGTTVERFVMIVSGTADASPGRDSISATPTVDRGTGEGCQAIYRTGRSYLISDLEREGLATAGWSF